MDCRAGRRAHIRQSARAQDTTLAQLRRSMTDLRALETELLAAVASANDEPALETVRVAALGRNGSISALLKTLGTMSPEARKEQGALINGLKDRVTVAIATRREALKQSALDQRLNTESLDVTLPVPEPPTEVGRIHPITQVVDELTAIFADMGFAIAEGPDIETDDYNFTKLNFPEGHPAREMQDTFFFKPKPDGSQLLLRTHTSPVQIRMMLAQKPPIRVIIPGRTYRSDSDQTHTPMFHQVEGLVIDTSSHLGHLKWILQEFCKAFFEVDQVKMRFGPPFFPSPSPRSRSTFSADATRERSDSARATTGWRFWAAAWCIRTCCVIAGLIPTNIRASLGVSASTASPCSNTACRICARSSRLTCGGSHIMVFDRSISRLSREDWAADRAVESPRHAPIAGSIAVRGKE